ncbi:hypothetical protein Tco_0517460 [Tanacetum coccineum]
MSMTIHSSIKARILEAQNEASKDVNTLAKMLRRLDNQFERKDNDELYFGERIWVPAYGSLRTLITDEAHATNSDSDLNEAKIFDLPALEDSSPLALLSNPSISAIHFPIIGSKILAVGSISDLTRIANVAIRLRLTCASLLNDLVQKPTLYCAFIIATWPLIESELD